MAPDEKQIFGQYIRAEGLRETVQRTLILETFLGTSDHVSIEDIYSLVNRKKRRVGFATVYRTMKLIADCGLAREVTFDDGVARFEHTLGRHHHHHLICTQCHKIIEFTSGAMDAAEKRVVEKHDFKSQYHRMEIFGLCRDCRKRAQVDRDGD